MTQLFFDRLRARDAQVSSLLCVGLDPEPDRLPAPLRGAEPIDGIVEFLRRVIDATVDLVAAYKPNLAFYEALGPRGLDALFTVRQHIPREVPVVGDAKRGDIDNTMRRYAAALFDVYDFDAVTASPYLGRDAIEPMAARPERGVYLLCRTSNAGSGEIADLAVTPGGAGVAPRPLYLAIAEKVRTWNSSQNLGLVVGATYPEELARVREVTPDLPILLPGVGAQGGLLEASVKAGIDPRGGGLLVNASRQVLFASGGDDYPEAARRAAQTLRERINRSRA
ncbi:MAG TPA: orotidine-5'-phosphate decarboxylase [Chloroflexota bacterium]|nr:orotidine-5'-phosphate decarboxylase [Chloroflexota bacterium]